MRSSCKDFITLFILGLVLPAFAHSQLQKIYLNPKAPGNAKQSDFVDSIHFIPLEIKEDMKLVAYTSIQITEKYFLLIDYESKALIVYAKDGRFVRKISFKKLGEGFYPGYRQNINALVFFGNNKNYALTPADMVKIRLDWDNPKNQKYFKKYRINLSDTSFSLEKDVPDENDILQSFQYYGKYFMQGRINTSPLYHEGQDFELKIYKDKKLVKSYFPYDRKNEPRFLFTEESMGFNYTDTASINIVSRPFCDTVYKLIRDSVVPEYKLVMPLENSLPRSFFTTPFKSKSDRENYKRNNAWVFHQVQNFYETPQFYFFVVRYQSNFEGYIYQKKGNATYKTRNIKGDSSQYNLRLLNDVNVLKNGDKFYKVGKAGDLIEFFEQHKTVAVPKELEEFLKMKPHSDAPVIIEFKLKTTP